MRRILVILFLLASVIPSWSQPNVMVSPEIRRHLNSINQNLPFHDTVMHLTVSPIELVPKAKALNVKVLLDQGHPVENSGQFYLNYITLHPVIDFQPFINEGLSVNFSASTELSEFRKYGKSGIVYTFTPEELASAMKLAKDDKYRQYLVSYTSAIQRGLPQAMSKDETLVDMKYNPYRAQIVSVLEYSDSLWSQLSKYIKDNEDQVRLNYANSLVRDAGEELAYSAMKTGVTMRQVYRNRAHTDSLLVEITGDMWPQIMHSLIQSAQQKLADLSKHTQQSCPAKVDSVSTLVSCEYDANAKTLTYTSLVSPELLASLQSHSLQESLTGILTATLSSNSNTSLLNWLIISQTTLVYSYKSENAEPVQITFPPSKLKTINR